MLPDKRGQLLWRDADILAVRAENTEGEIKNGHRRPNP
jgi:hypothetical protein